MSWPMAHFLRCPSDVHGPAFSEFLIEGAADLFGRGEEERGLAVAVGGLHVRAGQEQGLAQLHVPQARGGGGGGGNAGEPWEK